MSVSQSSDVRSRWHRPRPEEEVQRLRTLLLPLIQNSALFADRDEGCWLDEAQDLGLIPTKVAEILMEAAFLGETVLAAQAAQRKWGPPASALIGIALHVSRWDARKLPGGNDWFFAEARKLATDGRFRPAMDLAHDAELYLRKLSELGYCAEIDVDVEDILSPMERCGLTECDLAGIVPLGEFRHSRYAGVRDAAGRVELKPAIDERVFAGWRADAALRETAPDVVTA